MKLDDLKIYLREDRVKHGCDYAIAHKYGKTHIICGAVWEDAIREACLKFKVEIETLHTWPDVSTGVAA